jgi:hypothetical protein
MSSSWKVTKEENIIKHNLCGVGGGGGWVGTGLFLAIGETLYHKQHLKGLSHQFESGNRWYGWKEQK